MVLADLPHWKMKAETSQSRVTFTLRLLNLARKAYRGEYVDNWEGLGSEVIALVNHMKNSIESYFSI